MHNFDDSPERPGHVCETDENVKKQEAEQNQQKEAEGKEAKAVMPATPLMIFA